MTVRVFKSHLWSFNEVADAANVINPNNFSLCALIIKRRFSHCSSLDVFSLRSGSCLFNSAASVFLLFFLRQHMNVTQVAVAGERCRQPSSRFSGSSRQTLEDQTQISVNTSLIIIVLLLLSLGIFLAASSAHSRMMFLSGPWLSAHTPVIKIPEERCGPLPLRHSLH